MNAETAIEFDLEVGEEILYNFAGSPAGRGVFLGMTALGWIAVEQYNRRDDEREVVHLNPALLCTISRSRRESDVDAQAETYTLADAIARVQKIRDELGPLDEDCFETLDSEDLGRHAGALDAYDTCLDILQALAHGIRPAQGA